MKNYDDMLSRFHLIPERNGQTDGRTDLLSRVSMLTRDKNWKQMMSIHVIRESDVDNFLDNLRQETKVRDRSI